MENKRDGTSEPVTATDSNEKAGFRALPSEWWHFNYCSRDVAKQKYKLIP